MQKLVFITTLLVISLQLVLSMVHGSTVLLESKLYMGGSFSQVNGTDYNNVMGYDLKSQQLFTMENGTDGMVHVVHMDANGDLYIGGAFTKAGSSDCGPIAVWKKGGSKWESLHELKSADFSYGSEIMGIDTNCVNGTCKVFIAGSFDLTSIAAVNLAYYSGSSWVALNNTCTSSKTITTFNTGSDLNVFVGGEFIDGSNTTFYAGVNNLQSNSWTYFVEPVNVTSVQYNPTLVADTLIIAADSFSNDCSGLCAYNFVDDSWSSLGSYGAGVSNFVLLKSKEENGIPSVYLTGNSFTDVQTSSFNQSSISTFVPVSYPNTGNVITSLDICSYPVGAYVSGCRPGTLAAGGNGFLNLYSPGKNSWSNILDGLSGSYQIHSVKFWSNTNPVVFTNCKFVGSNSIRFEWTIDTTNNQLYCRATIPTSAVYASFGFKSISSRLMANATIYLGYSGNNVNEYYTSSSGSTSKPTLLTPNYLSYSAFSVDNDGYGILSIVRPLTKPSDVSFDGYYEFNSNLTDTAIMFASKSSGTVSSPTGFSKHSWTQAGVVIDLFTSSQCLTQCYGIDYNMAGVCSGHGNCTAKNTCQCKPGYSGDNCENVYYQCYGVDYNATNVCSGNGTCSQPNVCDCLNGYSGSNCQTPPPENPSVYCFNKLSSDLTVCSGHGSCVSNNTCVCNGTWIGSDCSTLNTTTDSNVNVNVTSNSTNTNNNTNNGDISNSNSTSTENGTIGNNTNVNNNTNNNDNINNGTNTNSNNTNINTNTTNNGNNSTDNNLNNNNGTNNNSNSTNDNNNNLNNGTGNSNSTNDNNLNTGNNTNVNNQTNNNSNTTDNNNNNNLNGTTNNNTTNDDNDNLNNNGTTIDNSTETNNSSGNTVQCFGVDYYLPSVCNGHGSCLSENVCNCDSDWTGLNCSNPVISCFGVSSTDSSVCSGKGSCISNDLCTCQSGWTGSSCSAFTCYSIQSSDKTVCSGHGSCVSVDSCTCATGWTGNDCSTPKNQSTNSVCFGKDATDPNVCLGNGVCENSECTCKNLYFGSQCGFILYTTYPRTVVPLNANIQFQSLLANNNGLEYESVTYKWTQTSGPTLDLEKITLAGTSSPDFVIQGNTDSFNNGLVGGTSYSFRITFTLVENSGQTFNVVRNFKIVTNQAPVISSYQLVDSNNTEITSGVAGSTSFKLTVLASDADNQTLSYAFGYISNNIRIFFGPYSKSNVATFKLPFIDGGKVMVVISVKDTVGQTVEQQIAVNVTDPTVGLSDSQISSYVSNLVNTGASVADLDVATSFLNKVSSNATVDNTAIRTNIINILATGSSSADPSTVLQTLSSVTYATKEITADSSAVVLNLLNNLTSNAMSSGMSTKVIEVASNILAVPTTPTSSSTEIIKNVLSSAAKSAISALATGQSQVVSNANVKMFVTKTSLEALSTPNVSAIGVSNMNIPTDSLKSLLTSAGIDPSMPISLGVTATPSSVYSYLPTTLTSSILMINILDDSGNVLDVSNLAKPIEFETSYTGVDASKVPKCVYYDKVTKSMSSSGVETIILADNKVKCRCYHLTDFTTTPIVKPVAQPTVQPSVKKSTKINAGEKLSYSSIILFVFILGFLLF